MPYIYLKVDHLEGTEKVGSKQCVALLQHYANLHLTAMWKEGKVVMGNLSIPRGTAIATFVNGKYSNKSTGNHAAFYLAQDSGGIWIMDQWSDPQRKPTVSARYISKKGKLLKGGFVNPSSNADAYSIIE